MMNGIEAKASVPVIGRNDSQHEIVQDVPVFWGGGLHRFVNAGGVPYSAIYDKHGVEVFGCEREKERDMIEYWNHEYQHDEH